MSYYTDIEDLYVSWSTAGKNYIGMIDGANIEVNFKVNKLRYHSKNLYAVGDSVIAKYSGCSLALVWKKSIGGAGLAVDDGVYVLGSRLVKLSFDGEILWEVAVTGTWIDAKLDKSYVAGDDKVYILNKQGNIIATKDVPGVTHVVYGDELYWAGTSNGKVFVGSKASRLEGDAMNVTGIVWRKGVFITGRLNGGLGEFDDTVTGDVYLALARGGCWIRSAGAIGQGDEMIEIGEEIVTSNKEVPIPPGTIRARVISIGSGGEGGSRGALIEGEIELNEGDVLSVEVDQDDAGLGGSGGSGGEGGEVEGSNGVDGERGGRGGMASIVKVNGEVVVAAGSGGGNSYDSNGSIVIGGDAGRDGNGNNPGLSDGIGGKGEIGDGDDGVDGTLGDNGGRGGDGAGSTQGQDSITIVGGRGGDGASGGRGGDGGIISTPVGRSCGEANPESDFTWSGSIITGYIGTSPDVIIPISKDGVAVTTIGNNAFENNSIVSNICGESIMSIGNYSFINCSNLTSISFPNATIIGNIAFYNCDGLTSISFPKVTSIGNAAFQGCNNLDLISFPNVSSIGDGAFKSCNNLTSVSFPNATIIENDAFYSCNNLNSISFPSVDSIGDYAFYSCSNLVLGSFPNASSIGSYVFTNCDILDSVSLPNVNSIGNYTLAGCSNLTALYLPSSAPTLGGFDVFIGSQTPTVFIPCGEPASGYDSTGWPSGIVVENRILIYFNINGVGRRIPDQYLECGSGIPTSPVDPTSPGFSFVDWYSDSTLTIPFDFTLIPSKNTTIYAGWREEITWYRGVNNEYIAAGNIVSVENSTPYMSFSGNILSGEPNDDSSVDVKVVTDNVSRLLTINIERLERARGGDGGNGANGGGGGGNGFPHGGGGGAFDSSGAGGLSFLNGEVVSNPPVTSDSRRVTIQFFAPGYPRNRVSVRCRPIVATTNGGTKYLWRPN